MSDSVGPQRGQPTRLPVPGILQARKLEWAAISFSDAWKWKVKGKSLSRVRLLATPWTAAYQAPLSMGFSRQEYWTGLPLPSPENLHSFKQFYNSLPKRVVSGIHWKVSDISLWWFSLFCHLFSFLVVLQEICPSSLTPIPPHLLHLFSTYRKSCRDIQQFENTKIAKEDLVTFGLPWWSSS